MKAPTDFQTRPVQISIGVSFWWAEVDSNLKEKCGIPLFSRLLAITTHQQPKVELFIFILFFDYFRQTKNLSTLTGG